MKKILLPAILVVLLAGLAVYLTQKYSGANSAKHNLRIAVNIPLTGPVAAFSGQYGNGLQKGIDDACKELGVDRTLISVDLQDNQGNASTAASIAQKQLLTGFDIYISGVIESKAVAHLVEPECSAHFILNYWSEYVHEGKNRMRVLPHFGLEGDVYARYSLFRKARRVTGITLSNPEALLEFSKYVKPVLEENNIEFSLETYDFDNSDFKTIAAKVKQGTPDLILISGFSHHVSMILDALRSQAMIADGNVLCIMDFNELLTDPESNKKFSGVAFVATPFSYPENQAAELRWIASYEREFGPEPTFVTAYAYDTGKLLVSTLAEHGIVTHDTIIKTTPIKGVCGEIRLDASGDFSTPLGVMLVADDGSIRKIELDASNVSPPEDQRRELEPAQ